MGKILEGKAVAVLIDTTYIPKEIKRYEEFFTACGARVDFLSLLWGEDKRTIVSTVGSPDDKIESMVVDKDVADYNPDDYAIVLVAANYVACRLREIPPMGSFGGIEELRYPPAVKFFIGAMRNKKIVKGALCHALWLLTPAPELLKGRKVICHTVVLADIHNAGATYVPKAVVTDDDLVTGRASGNVNEYTEALVAAYETINQLKQKEK
ncbi:MAG: DJ-1/PfpI family protein [Fibromonadaceae bacterium]|jgi:protease I|nr:DJ-1/PfpI family protein [Fibromonadaceae bacterium]